jgi:uncharacterized membrane protein YkoI
MKFDSKLCTALSLVIISSGAMAVEKDVSEKQVPAAVHSSFKQAYPGSKDVKYQEETADGKTVYEVEFKDKGKNHEASYSAEGSLIETEETIKTSELPKPIVDAVKAKYPKAVLKEAEKVLKPDGTVSGYEVDITEGKTALELELDNTGKILKAEVEKKG